MSYPTNRPSVGGQTIDTGRDIRKNVTDTIKQRKPEGVGWFSSAGIRVPMYVGITFAAFAYLGYSRWNRNNKDRSGNVHDISENNVNTVQSAASNMKHPNTPVSMGSGGGSSGNLQGIPKDGFKPKQ